MSDRTVKTTLTLQATGYLNGMDQVARKTRESGSEIDRLAQKRQSFEVLGRAGIAFGLAVAIGVGMAIAKYAEFDEAMSNVNAVTQETTENQKLLRDAALDAGGRTVYTAREAANAVEELAKAGIATADVLGGALNGSLDLAASGQLAVARAAEITGITLKQFSLDGSEAGRVADVLSAGANKAVGSVEDLAQGLKFVGPVSDSMNVSLEDTTATLALFADRGIIGEQAGTSLRGMLASLTSPSAAARKELDRLGVTLYDQQGQFLGLENTTGELNRTLADLTDAERDASLGILFGNQQVTAARVLVASGAETWRDYRTAVDDSGIASRIAADRLDNLSGDVEKLGGAFDTALIQSGSSANDVLREIVQTATALVDWVGSLPTPVLGAGVALVTLAGATALAGGAFLTLVPKVAAAKAALGGIGTGALLRSIGSLGGGLAIAGGYMAFFATTAADAKAKTQAFKDTLDPTTGAVTKYTREFIAKSLAENEWVRNSATDVGLSLEEITDALIAGGSELEAVKAKFAGQNNLVDFFNGSGVAAGNASQSIRELSSGLESSKDEFEATPKPALSAAESYKAAATEADVLQSNLSELIDTINKANGVGQDAVSTNASYQDALAEVAATIAEAKKGADGYSTSLDESTAAGSANADMFASLAAKSQEAAQAQLDLDGDTGKYLDTLNTGRQTLYDQIVALTGNADAAQALTDKIYAIPTQAEIQMIAETTEAQRKLDQIRRTVQELSGSAFSVKIARMQLDEYATGGYTGDGNPADVAGVTHRKEWVSTAETVAKPSNRAALEYMHAGGDISQWSAAQPQGMWLAAPPTYASTAAAPQQSVGSTVEINAHGVDPQTVANLLFQRLGAEMATR